jgi:hypothetical protein
MGFNSAFKGLTTTIVAPPSNASKWQMGFNSAFKGLKLFIPYVGFQVNRYKQQTERH